MKTNLILAILCFALGSALTTNLEAKKSTTYVCNKIRVAGNDQQLTTYMNSQAKNGWQFNHWDSQNYNMCWSK